eukprot:357322-Chlamydomonas_euryale.AAC.8
MQMGGGHAHRPRPYDTLPQGSNVPAACGPQLTEAPLAHAELSGRKLPGPAASSQASCDAPPHRCRSASRTPRRSGRWRALVPLLHDAVHRHRHRHRTTSI